MPGRVLFASSYRSPVGALMFGRGCVDFSEVSEQLLDPSGWKLGIHGGFFRDERQRFVIRRDAS